MSITPSIRTAPDSSTWPCSPPPKVSLLYARESPEHGNWVASLASRLLRCGIDVLLDQWDAQPGDDLTAFMEAAVRNADFVIAICTPQYQVRAQGRLGGVGYETSLIGSELLLKSNLRKFIPVLRSGQWAEAGPPWGTCRYYLDLRGDPYSEEQFERLLAAILGPGKHPDRPAQVPVPVSRPTPKGTFFALPDRPTRQGDYPWAERIVAGPLMVASRRHDSGELYDFIVSADGAFYLPLPDSQGAVLRQHRDFGLELSRDKGRYTEKFNQTGVRLR